MKRVLLRFGLAGASLIPLLAVMLLIYTLVRGDARPGGTTSARSGHRAGSVTAQPAGAPGYHVTRYTTTTTSRGGAWISLQSYAATPRVLDIGITGAGFAPAEAIDLHVSGRGGTARTGLRADGSGRVIGTVHMRIAPLAAGPLRFVALGEQSHHEAAATFIVVPYVPVLSLAPAAAPPGGSIDVSGQGFAPHEVVWLSVDGRVVRRARADSSGGPQLQPGYRVPFTAPASRFTLTATGELSGRSASQEAYVLPLQPWARASAYVVHDGDRVQFDVRGFAPGEIVKVYVNHREVGQSNGPTDGQGAAGGLGPFAVHSGSDALKFTFVGARSHATTMVTLTRIS